MNKPILVLDFDGVINSYASGWIEHDFIPDPPVPGAMEFLAEAYKHFDVKIFSSRSDKKFGGTGRRAMCTYIKYWAKRQLPNDAPDFAYNAVINAICNDADAWPEDKPPAFLTIDDRAICFDGTWPTIESLKAFKPWNKR